MGAIRVDSLRSGWKHHVSALKKLELQTQSFLRDVDQHRLPLSSARHGSFTGHSSTAKTQVPAVDIPLCRERSRSVEGQPRSLELDDICHMRAPPDPIFCRLHCERPAAYCDASI